MGELGRIISLLKSWIRDKRVGSIQVNFMKGGVTNVNIKESLKVEDIRIDEE